ncbi:MAG: hypothetical protein HY906_19275 [Deltaproteobacteria bacterium]|nr:hypothetical protein [Deltaproteobacteria bacterium]
MRARRLVMLALCATLALAGCKQGSGSSDGGGDAPDDACDLWTEPRFDAGPPIPLGGPIPPNFFDVWGAAPDDIWAVGSAGLVMHWDGTSWTEIQVPLVGDLLGISGVPPDDTNPAPEIWAVGLGGAILHYDGTTWTQQQMPFDDGGVPMGTDLHAVASAGRGLATAVGIDATMVETVTGGASWTKKSVPTQETLNGIWSGGGGSVAVGNLGTILEWDGAAWQRRRISGLTAHLKGVWGWDPGNVFVLGLNGTLATNQGGTWTKLAPAAVQPRDIECQQGPAAWPNVYLRDAWGAEGRIVLVGWSGTIMVGESNVATVYQVTEQRLESIWGTRIIDTPGGGDGGIPDAGLEYHYEASIVGVTGAIIKVWLHGNP